jgi:hypothetical protein
MDDKEAMETFMKLCENTLLNLVIPLNEGFIKLKKFTKFWASCANIVIDMAFSPVDNEEEGYQKRAMKIYKKQLPNEFSALRIFIENYLWMFTYLGEPRKEFFIYFSSANKYIVIDFTF